MAGVSLDIDGPATWIQPLHDAWLQWTPFSDAVPWRVSIVADATQDAPAAPLFDVLPRCHAGICALTAAGFRGNVNAADGTACLVAHPRATPADVGYFVRIAAAVQAFTRGGLLFHAAGVLHRGQGYAFFGLSGSGKTTAAQFSAPDPVLNDDLLLVWPGTAGWQMVATPFGKRRGDVRVAPMRALLRLLKDEQVYLARLPRGRALGELVANTPVLSGDPVWLPQVLARWGMLLVSVEAYALHFRRDPAFWEAIDAELG